MEELKNTLQFIKELYPNKSFIPLHEPSFGGNEKKYLNECIDSTFVSSVGAFVDRFEREMEQLTATKKAVAVVNGTSGLQVALRLAGVAAGEEVITQALSFVATANAIKHNGADPIFLDVDQDTMGLSPKALSAFLSEHTFIENNYCYHKNTGKKIAACVPMHTFGFACRIDEIVEICSKHNIPVIEDAAEALGSTYKGQALGSFGMMGVFSFNGNKIITSGGGGCIVTHDVGLGEKAKHLTTTAKAPHPYEYFHDELGYNYRMPNLNAALLCAQLEQLPGFLEEKKKLAKKYGEALENTELKMVQPIEKCVPNFWLIAIMCKGLEERNQLLEFSNKNKVMTRPIWNLLFKLPMYSDCWKDDQQNALFLEERVVNLPSSVV